MLFKQTSKSIIGLDINYFLTALRRKMMSDNLLIMEKKGALATLTINRPQVRNSLNPALLFKIADCLGDLAQTDEIRAVVIRGEGGMAFSSGYDISEIPNDISGLNEKNPIDFGFEAIEQYPYPVIAMID